MDTPNAASFPHVSLFDRIHDLVVVGGGHAGVAAALESAGSGKSIVLVERQAAPLWEAGWAFALDAGGCGIPAWRSWIERLEAVGGSRDGVVDGAICETQITALLAERGVHLLYYATPVAVERGDDGLDAVILGTKSGLRRLTARRWIDASEGAELLRLCDPLLAAPQPASLEVNLFFARTAWPETVEPTAIPFPARPDATLSWRRTLWPDERCLGIELPGGCEHPRLAWPAALAAARAALPELLAEAAVSHGSFVPLPRYAAGAVAPADLPVNVVDAVPGRSRLELAGLGDRFALGVAAAARARSCPAARLDPHRLRAPLPAIAAGPETRFDVVVAGAGTGGAIAAIAAARAGARVCAIDPLPFAGGIGSGGGIHWYYLGVKGGLQEELDERIRALMPLFGPSSQISGFHPDAKKAALEAWFVECGVQQLGGGTVVSVERDGARIERALVATPDGPRMLAASSWIDATGDGDLAAMAGAEHSLGRQGDGMLHAYTQSAGSVFERNGKAVVSFQNYDSGFVDPTDVEDLTRARVAGVLQYRQQRYDTVRPTYIAPAIGLRQARHIVTDHVLSLADLIERRRFPDAVGRTGSHYDNHAVDFEFESDEGMYWTWVCRSWWARTACEIPYRMLLPRGLDNAWMACRAFGVSIDAHHSMRMQRGIQRAREVAGLAAAHCARSASSSRAVPMPWLREQLIASGALSAADGVEEPFGPRITGADFQSPSVDESGRLAGWLARMEADDAGDALWWLYRSRASAETAIVARLTDADPLASWRAAAVLAMWEDPRAEARLCSAIATREHGFSDAPEKADQRPEKNHRVVPHWLVSIALLRRCGTPACLPTLATMAQHPHPAHNLCTTIALTCERVASRHPRDAGSRAAVLAILDRLLASEHANAIGSPNRNLLVAPAAPTVPGPSTRPSVVEDFRWQLHLIVARTRAACGLEPLPEARAFLEDPRALVRRAFQAAIVRQKPLQAAASA